MNQRATFMGLNVVVASVQPKMRLSEDVTVSPEFRAEIDAWMLEFFGTHCLVPKGTTYVLKEYGTILVHPDDFGRLKQAQGAAFA